MSTTQTFDDCMPIGSEWDREAHASLPAFVIPMAMLAEHDAQCKANHAGQDLRRIQARHGMSACEALAILDDRPWTPILNSVAHSQLKERLAAFLQQSTPAQPITPDGGTMHIYDGRDHDAFYQGMDLPMAMFDGLDARVRANQGGRTIEQVRKQGGLPPCAAIAILEDRPWHSMPFSASYPKLRQILQDFLAQQAPQS